jgi:predicted transposase/invertase (TIGR01784 family)
MAELIYELTRDTVFKVLFVKYPELLKTLVSKVLGIDINDMTEFEVTNSEIAPANVKTKFCRLDVKMKVNGQTVNLEVQVDDNKDYKERSLYYWARCYEESLPKSKKYIELPRTICINIVAFKMFEDTDDFHSEFRVLEVTRHTELTDRMCLHYFELPKLPEVAESDAEDVLKLWLALFNAKTEEELSRIERIGGKPMTQVVQAYRSVLTSEDFIEMERLREKAYYDEISALDYATNKGIAQGITQGITQGKAEIVQNMHKKGFGIADIVKATDLSEQEVKNILKS